MATSLAVQDDAFVLDVDDRLGVLAVPAEHELGDEAIEIILELVGIMSTIDNPAIVLGVCVGLSTQLEPKVFDDIYSDVHPDNPRFKFRRWPVPPDGSFDFDSQGKSESPQLALKDSARSFDLLMLFEDVH